MVMDGVAVRSQSVQNLGCTALRFDSLYHQSNVTTRTYRTAKVRCNADKIGWTGIGWYMRYRRVR